jgi:prepilin-type N-terminal cleavage/methylation domain-containing protein
MDGRDWRVLKLLMKTTTTAQKTRRGYTFTEVMVSVGVIGVLFVSLYAAFSAAFTVIRVARENLRATQILMEKTETLRLYTWDQLRNPSYLPTTFKTNSPSLGVTYHGNLTLSNPGNIGTPSYLTNMRTVTISVRWTNNVGSSQPHYREMQTQAARWGVQNYVFGYRQ